MRTTLHVKWDDLVDCYIKNPQVYSVLVHVELNVSTLLQAQNQVTTGSNLNVLNGYWLRLHEFVFVILNLKLHVVGMENSDDQAQRCIVYPAVIAQNNLTFPSHKSSLVLQAIHSNFLQYSN